MEVNLQTTKANGNGNGHLVTTRKSQSIKTGSIHEVHHSIFDPMKYMLKLPKSKKITLPSGQVRWEQTEPDYLPVAARIAWFRDDFKDVRAIVFNFLIGGFSKGFSIFSRWHSKH
jgi:hypothetical protein